MSYIGPAPKDNEWNKKKDTVSCGSGQCMWFGVGVLVMRCTWRALLNTCMEDGQGLPPSSDGTV